MKRQRRRRTRRLLLAALVAIAAALAALVLNEPAQLDSKAVSDRPETSDSGTVVLAATAFQSSGGEATIRWSAGEVGFRRGNTSLLIGLRVDGKLLATVRLGAAAMAAGKSPAMLAWSGPMRSGLRRVRVQVENRVPPPPAVVQRGAGTLEVDEH